MLVYQVSLDLSPVIVPVCTWQEKLRKVCPGLTPLTTPALESKKEGKARKVSSDPNMSTASQALPSSKKTRRVTFDLNPIIIPAPKLEKKAKKVSFNLFPETVPLYRWGEATPRVSFNLTPIIINSQSTSGRSKAHRVALDSRCAEIAPRASHSSKTEICEVGSEPTPPIIPQNLESGNNLTPKTSFNPYEANPQQVTPNIPPQPFAGTHTFPGSSYSMYNSHPSPDDDVYHDSEPAVAGPDYPMPRRGIIDTTYAKGTQGYEDITEPRQLRYLQFLRDCRELRECRRRRTLAVLAACERYVKYKHPRELGDIENMPGGKRSYKNITSSSSGGDGGQ